MSVPIFDINKAREWVISESNSGKYDKIEEECKKQVKEFLEEYNIDNLKKLSGKELLEKMFLTKNSLTHELEVGMTKNILGIRGGSAYKFSLFKKNDEQFWKSGTPMNPKMLSDEEAIKVAEEELECLIQAINIINEIKQRNKNKKIKFYITFDIDCLDVSYVFGTGTPQCNGLTPYECDEALRNLHDLDIAGFDIVELNPKLDDSHTSFVIAEELLYHFLALGLKKEKLK